MNHQLNHIRTIGALESCSREIGDIRELMTKTPDWTPSRILIRQCDESLRLLDRIQTRFERKLVVTLVGPCGAGKSTLLNALSGRDDLSRIGRKRPTTEEVVVFCGDRADASILEETLNEENLKIRVHPGTDRLDHVLLVDTPDTDSMALSRHRAIVERVVGVSDILLCVFDGENPKRRDHVDYLAPFIQKFDGESIVAVLNKCDRLSLPEMDADILPDFIKYISHAWERPAEHGFCVSARRNLENPDWSKGASPRHDFDQFGELSSHVFGTLNRAGAVIDRRLANARRIRDFIVEETEDKIARHREALEKAISKLDDARKTAMSEAVLHMGGENSPLTGIQLLVYQRLAQRWVGPVGWVLALWSRILVFGAGLMNVLRIGNPVRQAWGLFSSARRFKKSRSSLKSAHRGDETARALSVYRLHMERAWPDLAEDLVRGGFLHTVRRTKILETDEDRIGDKLSFLWLTALNDALDRRIRALSGGFIQLVFNLPVVGIMGYTGWIMVREFFNGRILSSDFFLHAFLTIGLVLFLIFFLLQGIIRLFAKPKRITAGVLRDIHGELDAGGAMQSFPVAGQVNRLLTFIKGGHAGITKSEEKRE